MAEAVNALPGSTKEDQAAFLRLSEILVHALGIGHPAITDLARLGIAYKERDTARHELLGMKNDKEYYEKDADVYRRRCHDKDKQLVEANATIAALRDALAPFANYACEPACNPMCNNCRARAALATTRKES